MNNYQYVEKLFFSVERVIVDTSALMAEGFQEFVKKNRALILASGKKLYVHNAVYKELARHLSSDNPYKVKCAMAAIDLMVHNEDIFVVEVSALTEREIKEAFADPILLSELTINKTRCKQLLIANDQKLSLDAYNLNHQESCRGQKVFVCYISFIGELQCCDCVFAESRPEPVKPAETTPITPVRKDPAAISKNVSVSHSITKKNEPVSWSIDWLSFGLGIVGAGIPGVLGYGIYQLIKSVNRNMYHLEVV